MCMPMMEFRCMRMAVCDRLVFVRMAMVSGYVHLLQMFMIVVPVFVIVPVIVTDTFVYMFMYMLFF